MTLATPEGVACDDEALADAGARFRGHWQRTSVPLLPRILGQNTLSGGQLALENGRKNKIVHNLHNR